MGFQGRLALLSAMECGSRWTRALQLWPKTAMLAVEAGALQKHFNTASRMKPIKSGIVLRMKPITFLAI